MDLAYALRLSQSPCIAFTGSGGKTTALFILARELLTLAKRTGAPQTILVTATTHLAIEQTNLADHHFVVRTEADLPHFSDGLPAGILLFTGTIGEDNRTLGLSRSILDAIYHSSREHQLPLLIEADGSRQRPLKAPGIHEPVIPEWSDIVVFVAGLSALGRPFNDRWVYNTDRFAEISGLSPDAPITIESLQKVLTSPQGGLKGIPSQAKRVVLLNQADTSSLAAAGYRLGNELLSTYPAVIVSSLVPKRANDETRVDLLHSIPSDKVLAVIEPVAGILLAAGESSRMGQPKQILNWHGQPLVRHIAGIALAANLHSLIVVTGAYKTFVETALSSLSVAFMHNPDWRSGQSTSIKAGMQALSSEHSAVIFFLADQPLINEQLVRSLIETHSKTLSPIIAPVVEDQRSNPVLFDRITFNDLSNLQGDNGGRTLFPRYPVRWIPWNDPRIMLDIDTVQDYERLLSLDDNLKPLA